MRRCRLQYLDAVLRSDTSWFDLNDPCALPTTIAAHVATLGRAVGSKFGRIFQAVGEFLGGVIFAFAANWQLAFVMVGMIPIIGAMALWASTVMVRCNVENQSWYSEAGCRKI